MSDQPSQLPAPRVGNLWVHPNTNQLLDGTYEFANKSLRHYFGRDINGALAAWGILEGEVAALSDVNKILEKISIAEGSEIHEVYFPDSKSYVAVVFQNLTDQAKAWVAFGYVDHSCKTPGSIQKPDSKFWRTLLPTWNGSRVRGVNSPKPQNDLCPDCYLYVTVSGKCPQCEWSPSSDV